MTVIHIVGILYLNRRNVEWHVAGGDGIPSRRDLYHLEFALRTLAMPRGFSLLDRGIAIFPRKKKDSVIGTVLFVFNCLPDVSILPVYTPYQYAQDY